MRDLPCFPDDGTTLALVQVEACTEMLKITQEEPCSNRTAFKFEGSLVGLWVEHARGQFGPKRLDMSSVVLDLSQLTFADLAGAQLLKDLLRRGARIAACSSFIRELLNLEITG